MSKKEFGLLLGAVVVVALFVGGVLYMNALGNAEKLALAPAVPIQPSRVLAEETVVTPDPALCGNGIVDAGEDCDPLDPATAFNPETGKECRPDCTRQLYRDPLECMDARHMEFCVDANNNPVANYYDCVDAQHEYCSGLIYN